MDKLTSFDNRPSIPALQKIEQDILLLLDIAAQTCTELSKTEEDSKLKLEKLTREYLTHVKNVREGLETQIQRITVDTPYQNSIYGAKKDAEISYMTAQVVHQELQDIKNYLEDKTPSLLVQPKEEEFRLINL